MNEPWVEWVYKRQNCEKLGIEPWRLCGWLNGRGRSVFRSSSEVVMGSNPGEGEFVWPIVIEIFLDRVPFTIKKLLF